MHTFKRHLTSSQINANSGFSYVLTNTTGEALTVSGAYLLYSLGTGGTSGEALYASCGLAFSIADIPSVTDFSALFDMYRLNSVNVKLYHMASSANSESGATTLQQTNCMVHSCIDYDDNTAFAASEAGLLSMMERQDYKVKRGGGGGSGLVMNRTIRPRHLVVTNDAAGATTARSLAPRRQWIDWAYTGVPHFGIKFIIEANSDSNGTNWVQTYRMVCTYNFSCKDVR